MVYDALNVIQLRLDPTTLTGSKMIQVDVKLSKVMKIEVTQETLAGGGDFVSHFLEILHIFLHIFSIFNRIFFMIYPIFRIFRPFMHFFLQFSQIFEVFWN